MQNRHYDRVLLFRRRHCMKAGEGGGGGGACNSTLFTMRHWLTDGQAGGKVFLKNYNLRHAAKMSALLRRIQNCSLLDIQ